MPSKNAFLEKQAKIQKACFDEGWALGVQQKLVDDVKVRDVRFLGLVKKVVKITENIAVVSIEPVSTMEIQDIARGR